MRIIFALFLGFVLVGCAKEYNKSDTVLGQQDGIRYAKKDMKPLNGILYERNPTGRYKIGEFKNGLEEGIHQKHYGRQLVYEGEYVNGLEEGIHKAWSEEGQLIYEGSFSDGIKNGIHRQWSHKGQLIREGKFIYGVVTGHYRVWFDNGVLEFDKTFDNGVLIGKAKIFNYNGELVYTLEQDGEVGIKTYELQFGTSKKEIYRNDILLDTEFYIDDRKVSYNEWFRYAVHN